MPWAKWTHAPQGAQFRHACECHAPTPVQAQTVTNTHTHMLTMLVACPLACGARMRPRWSRRCACRTRALPTSNGRSRDRWRSSEYRWEDDTVFKAGACSVNTGVFRGPSPWLLCWCEVTWMVGCGGMTVEAASYGGGWGAHNGTCTPGGQLHHPSAAAAAAGTATLMGLGAAAARCSGRSGDAVGGRLICAYIMTCVLAGLPIHPCLLTSPARACACRHSLVRTHTHRTRTCACPCCHSSRSGCYQDHSGNEPADRTSH